MREKRNFGERTKVLPDDAVRKKYFLLFEGKKTEEIYFEMLNNKKKREKINLSIELIPIIRSFTEEGWSNPKKMVDCIIQNIEEEKTQCYSYKTLCEWIMDYLIDEEIVTKSFVKASGIWEFMIKICETEIEYQMNYDVNDYETDCKIILEKLEEKLKEELKIKNLVDAIPAIIKYNKISYDEDIDKIYLIVDRDKKSFTVSEKENQYQYALDKCREKNFGLCVTNPCFEFWLALHFDKVFEYDREKIRKNEKEKGDKKFTECMLNELSPGYSKSQYDADVFSPFIDKAIENEKQFCEDIEGLEKEIGSNIGLLIKELNA